MSPFSLDCPAFSVVLMPPPLGASLLPSPPAIPSLMAFPDMCPVPSAEIPPA